MNKICDMILSCMNRGDGFMNTDVFMYNVKTFHERKAQQNP